MKPDEQHIRRALDLARAGVGLASPNPAVGAVVVDTAGAEVGTGTHTYDGVKHAEVLALEQAGPAARGGTLYLNLEPCSHRGRTGPCSDAVIVAGIRRVVCSMEDPNPRVAGQGFAKLRAAGIQVDVGPLEAEAKKLNEAFAKYIRTGLPLVTLKSAMSLDGKIAPPPSQTRAAERAWITGEQARAHVQQLRHEHDAILAGVGTVIVDDPLLTDRSGLPRRRPLLRVILDSSLRLPHTSQLAKTAKNDVLVFYTTADDPQQEELEKLGLCAQRVRASADGRPDLHEVMRALGQREITSVLIEGGATINAAALSSGVVDKLFLYYAPKILGQDAVPFIAGEGASTHSSEIQKLQLRNIQIHQFGNDLAIEGHLRDPYQD